MDTFEALVDEIYNAVEHLGTVAILGEMMALLRQQQPVHGCTMGCVHAYFKAGQPAGALESLVY